MWNNGHDFTCFGGPGRTQYPTESGIAQIRDRSATLRNASANVVDFPQARAFECKVWSLGFKV